MPNKNKKAAKRFERYLTVRFLSKTIHFTLDYVLLLGFIRKLHGRFWGLAAIVIMNTGLAICFAIKPEMLEVKTAFSDFGDHVRTAPYFAATMFFAAYALWRWRNYLNRTLKRSKPFTGLLLLTIIGMYLVALMPVSWEPWPYRIHFFGVALMGVSAACTVIVDDLLSKTRRDGNIRLWQIARISASIFILVGGFITFGSDRHIRWFQYSLLGEYLLVFGYSIWVIAKTVQGEGPRSKLSQLLKKIVVID